MSDDFDKDIDDTDLNCTDSIFVSNKSDKNGLIVIGLFLPYGNAEHAIITKEEALQVLENLKIALK